MSVHEKVKLAFEKIEAPKTVTAALEKGLRANGSMSDRVKFALDLANNPALATAGQLAAQQPSPALPQVNELMTQLALKQLQEELNKGTSINDPVEAENASLRRQIENLKLKMELAEKQQELGAAGGAGPGADMAGQAMGGMPPEGMMPPGGDMMGGGDTGAQQPGFEQALGAPSM